MSDSERGANGSRRVEGDVRAATPSKDEMLIKLVRETRDALQTIVGVVDFLVRTPLSTQQSEYIGYASSAAEQLEASVAKTEADLSTLSDCATVRGVDAVEKLLSIAREALGMDVSFVSRFTEGQMVFRALDGDASSFGWREGEGVPLERTFCGHIMEGTLPNVIPDVKDYERANDLDIANEANIGSYVGLPLQFSDGRVYGTLCCLSHSADPKLLERDMTFMKVLVRLVADQLEREELEAGNRQAQTKETSIDALLAALAARDGYTRDHSVALVAHATAVARRMGLSESEVTEIEQAAILHDIGKIGVADESLKKPGILTEAEWEDVRSHSVIGEKIVSATQGLAHITPVIRHVHERWDGKGYPDGLSGEEIPLASRIISVCDAFHAMTSERPYRKALGFQVALEELRKYAGVQFCPHTVEAFLDLVSDVDKEE